MVKGNKNNKFIFFLVLLMLSQPNLFIRLGWPELDTRLDGGEKISRFDLSNHEQIKIQKKIVKYIDNNWAHLFADPSYEHWMTFSDLNYRMRLSGAELDFHEEVDAGIFRVIYTVSHTKEEVDRAAKLLSERVVERTGLLNTGSMLCVFYVVATGDSFCEDMDQLRPISYVFVTFPSLIEKLKFFSMDRSLAKLSELYSLPDQHKDQNV